MYPDTEVLAFDGTLDGLIDQLSLIKGAMPKCPAFVEDHEGESLNRVRIHSKILMDGSIVWDIELFTAPK